MSDIKVEFTEELNPKQTDSAFYCWGDGCQVLAIVSKGDRTFHIVSNGEMRINLPDDEGVYRYTSDLLEAGIDTDEKLAEFNSKYEDQDIWVHNNWFEMYEVDENDEWWEVFDNVEEGIEAAKIELNKLDNE